MGDLAKGLVDGLACADPAARHSAVNPMYFKNQGSDVGRQPTVAGVPATVDCRPKINELIKLYTGYSTVPACF